MVESNKEIWIEIFKCELIETIPFWNHSQKKSAVTHVDILSIVNKEDSLLKNIILQ